MEWARRMKLQLPLMHPLLVGGVPSLWKEACCLFRRKGVIIIHPLRVGGVHPLLMEECFFLRQNTSLSVIHPLQVGGAHPLLVGGVLSCLVERNRQQSSIPSWSEACIPSWSEACFLS